MPILSLETKRYAIKLENFQGPLDLLLNLIVYQDFSYKQFEYKQVL